jgi:hypothetical protein
MCYKALIELQVLYLYSLLVNFVIPMASTADRKRKCISLEMKAMLTEKVDKKVKIKKHKYAGILIFPQAHYILS